MKKTRKIFISMAFIGSLLNNVVFATSEVAKKGEEGLPTKYIFIGIAALVIVLLLFLGYRMDTKDSSTTKVSHKAEKTMKKLSAKAEAIQQNSGEYEADNEIYEADDEEFNSEDLNGSIEYKADDEDSLFSAVIDEDEPAEEEEDFSEYDNGEFEIGKAAGSPIIADSNVPESEDEIKSELNEDVEEQPKEESEESMGEEFDTSIIDNLDDEDSIDSKKSFDETMLFNNSGFSATERTLEDEIDSLENINDNEINTNDDTEDSSFIEELKSFEEPESTFEGFSVAKKEDKLEEFNDEGEKNIVSNDIEENTSIPMDNDFLSQMEENLQKNKEDRSSKKELKSTKYTKKTTKKKEN